MSLEQRPKRNLDTLTPSQRKNKELFDAVPRTASLDSGRVHKIEGACGRCVDFAYCSRRDVRNAKADQNYCAWSKQNRTFRRAT